jgi:hypothetical protein
MSSLYVVVVPLLELVVLFARGDRAKELEVLVLGTSCRSFAVRSVDGASRCMTELATA